MGPVRFHFLISDFVIELFFVHKNHSRAYRSVLHLVSVFARAQPPCSLGICTVVTGTRKIAPCQMNQVHTVVCCCTCSLVSGELVPDTKFFARRHRYSLCEAEGSIIGFSCLCTYRPYGSCPAVFHRFWNVGSILNPQDRNLVVRLNSKFSCWLRPYPNGKGLRFLWVELGSGGFFVTSHGHVDDGEISKLGYKDGYIISICDDWGGAPRTSA